MTLADGPEPTGNVAKVPNEAAGTSRVSSTSKAGRKAYRAGGVVHGELRRDD
jgi:hypothetical protein